MINTQLTSKADNLRTWKRSTVIRCTRIVSLLESDKWFERYRLGFKPLTQLVGLRKRLHMPLFLQLQNAHARVEIVKHNRLTLDM